MRSAHVQLTTYPIHYANCNQAWMDGWMDGAEVIYWFCIKYRDYLAWNDKGGI